MADIIDRAQELQQHQLERQIAAARQSYHSVSADTCEDCDAPIPEARRMAITGVQCCIHCQQIRELTCKHFRA
ncbi:TraR/DksA family transcriptional regulator [Hafnia alvei]|uniref:TraR/DksA family transcriptional regulator n=1 Tax=Hafnia alvei TaxID=569 RepID=UPI00103474B7|nr:TraR/DksA family transcriptional regulator [Hafnia alvei]TBM13019.1 TraR/DksA family transcriptional regulator [Hafnia alvei]